MSVQFYVCMSNKRINAISCVCPASNFSHKFHICFAHRWHWPLPFYTTFSVFNLGWRSQYQLRSKPTFLHSLHLIRMKFGVVSKYLRLNILILLSWIKEKQLLLYRLHQKNIYDNRDYWILHFDSSLSGFDLLSRPQGCYKVQIYVPVISESFQLILVEFGVLLRLTGLTNVKFIFYQPIAIRGKEPYVCDF